MRSDGRTGLTGPAGAATPLSPVGYSDIECGGEGPPDGEIGGDFGKLSGGGR